MGNYRDRLIENWELRIRNWSAPLDGAFSTIQTRADIAKPDTTSPLNQWQRLPRSSASSVRGTTITGPSIRHGSCFLPRHGQRTHSYQSGHDVRERAFQFACRVVTFCEKLYEGGGVGRVMAPQLVNCSTSTAGMLIRSPIPNS